MRRIDSTEARRYLEEHEQSGNKVDQPLKEEIPRAGKLYLLQLEDADSFLSLIWYRGDGVRLLSPDGEARTLRDVAERLRIRSYTFQALSNDLSLPKEQHDPAFFKPCVPIDHCFDFHKFGWIAVGPAKDDERKESKHGSFYIFDGNHKALVLAKRLLAGETVYQPVKVLYIIPRLEW